LLSWFLRYLHCLENGSVAVSAAGTTADSAQKKDDDKKNEKPWYEQFPSLGNDGFDWKAGSERNTTGIWMWSQPHFIPRSGTNQKPLAVLLVDTQGMFDHETTMSLTASIFGFSTLLSSCQIYNVDKRIQEDNLQQLALFSEYARSAMGTEEKEEKQKKMEQAASLKNITAKEEEEKDIKEKDDSEKAELASSSSTKIEDTHRPFQHIEFLVRDWQVRLEAVSC
jgi:atlastin